jgi:hypothetical protein
MATNTVDTQALDNVFPTHDQAVLALLSAILNHPEIKNSQIYYPVLLGESSVTERITITSARDFSGIELIEPGLTLAVFPLHDDYDQKSSTFTARKSTKSVIYDDQYLGRSSTYNYGVKCTFNFVVQLYYQDSIFNAPVELLSDVVNFDSETPGFYPLTIPAVDSIQYKDRLLPPNILSLQERLQSSLFEFPFSENPNVPGTTLKKPTKLRSDPQTLSKESRLGGLDSSVSVTTLPGERIIRSWMSLLVKVIRSLVYLKPFALRNPTISMVDYPSTNWYRNSENLVFHTGYCLVSYDLIEADQYTVYSFPQPPTSSDPLNPPPSPSPPFPKVKEIVIDDDQKPVTVSVLPLEQQQQQQQPSTPELNTERIVYVEPDNEVKLSQIRNMFNELVVDGGFF